MARVEEDDLKPGTAGRYAGSCACTSCPNGVAWRCVSFAPDMLQEWVSQLMDGGYPAALPDGRDSKAAEHEKHP